MKRIKNRYYILKTRYTDEQKIVLIEKLPLRSGARKVMNYFFLDFYPKNIICPYIDLAKTPFKKTTFYQALKELKDLGLLRQETTRNDGVISNLFYIVLHKKYLQNTYHFYEYNLPYRFYLKYKNLFRYNYECTTKKELADSTKLTRDILDGHFQTT